MSKAISKLMRTANLINEQPTLFICPICSSLLTVGAEKSLVCSNNHTFDIAKQGYLNLLTRHIQTNYNRELFEARREVIVTSELYEALNEKLANIINKQTNTNQKLTIIDLGSGEGSHLNNVSNTLINKFNKKITQIGVDISKAGILEAAKNYIQAIWLVADLAKTPVANKSCDVILNILSPSNYEEFNRLLTDKGTVIKVVPRENYLKELRDFFYKDQEKEEYSNVKIVDHFKDNFALIDQFVINYTKQLDKSALKSLVNMTPLTWNASSKTIDQFLTSTKGLITVDLKILVGKKLKRG